MVNSNVGGEWNLRALTYTLRLLGRSPGFAASAIAILALSIGANTAIFTVVNALLLRSLPYAEPERLAVALGTEPGHERDFWNTFSYPFFRQLRGQTQSFSSLSACVFETFNMTGHGEPEQVTSARATANFFEVLGVKMLAGRGFEDKEDQPGGDAVAVLSHPFAARLFGDARQAVGQTITLDTRVTRVVGVLPPSFVFSWFGPRRDIWAPRVFEFNAVTPKRIEIGGPYFTYIGRLSAGSSFASAGAELQTAYAQYRRDKPTNYDASLNLQLRTANLQERLVADLRPALLILSAAVGFVLLIACANLASLMLSRALDQQKELAVRSALGAPRRALIGQMLWESVVLALLGGAFGLLLGYAATRGLAAYGPESLQYLDTRLDLRVLLFTLAISAASGILFGLAPAVRMARIDLNTMLREEGRGSTGGPNRNRARGALVILQVALSVVLLTGSGLLIQSFVRLARTPPGFDPKGVLTLQLPLPSAKYAKPEQLIAFYQNALPRVSNLTGVEAAAISTALPVVPTHFTPAHFEGQPEEILGRQPLINLLQVSPSYPKVMRIPLLSGRVFDVHDDETGLKVALVNQTTVRQFWPNQNPLGKKIRLGTLPGTYDVVGVLGDTKNRGLSAETSPEVMLPYLQMPTPGLTLSVRTALNPNQLIRALRQELARVDSDQPVIEVKTGEELLQSLGAQPRFTMLLLSAFSAVALLLALVGLYGLMAYWVAQRTHEFGVRVALGAAARDVLGLVLRRAMVLVIVGIALGAGAALLLARLLSAYVSTMLYRTSAVEPGPVVLSALLFVITGAVASYLPARKAMRVGPGFLR